MNKLFSSLLHWISLQNLMPAGLGWACLGWAGPDRCLLPLAVAVLGWKDCRNYDGGWLEYSQTSPGADKHPIEHG